MKEEENTTITLESYANVVTPRILKRGDWVIYTVETEFSAEKTILIDRVESVARFSRGYAILEGGVRLCATPSDGDLYRFETMPCAGARIATRAQIDLFFNRKNWIEKRRRLENRAQRLTELENRTYPNNK
jgi:hypothetical protein